MKIKLIITAASALLLAILPLMLIAGDKASKARIVTGNGKPSQCISPVHVTTIDGEQRYVNKLGFDLDPGEYSMKGRALIDMTYCKAPGRSSGKDPIEPITANFEAGKTYYLGYDHSASNRKDWKLVIWAVEG